MLCNFVPKKYKNYYPRVFLKECKYTEKERKILRYITNNIEICSDDFEEEQINAAYPARSFL